MQSIGKKAIVRSLMGGDDYWKENEHSHPIEIFLLLVSDELHVLINTSGDALHKRGYRTEAGEAPIKESLAATLVTVWWLEISHTTVRSYVRKLERY
jgi:putative N6-adenine-specific DNA methylase